MRQLFPFSALILAFVFHTGEAKLPDLTPKITHDKIEEIMHAHATHKTLTPELTKRILQTYLEELDPIKTYFIESDISPWTNPSESDLERYQKEMNAGDYEVFSHILDKLDTAILRRRELEKNIQDTDLPKHVKAEEFKDIKWATSEDELLTRLKRIRSLQLEGASKLSPEMKERSLQRIAKRQNKQEEEALSKDPKERERFILTYALKATAGSLDTHTSYFTPEEAAQFMISVQQRLFGIGAQLRDDINGFTITRIIEGGPAANNKELKLKDKIIAVNGEPVVGMDIADAVELIRGEENTPVTLTILRNKKDSDTDSEEKLNVTLNRGEVVLTETRYDVSYEPYADGVIAYVKLYSFYQDPDSSSASDLSREIQKLKNAHNVKGMILDLRSNAGGMLSQAVDVTGLFITKGVVVSIKDENGHVQHLRDVDGKAIYSGPLIVLINRTSASASEIVAQTLKDYGRALIVGDEHSYGKGSFQTFTLNTQGAGAVNPEGEYKVTRGRYYTVSGQTPQLTGVPSDIIVPGPLSESEIGEKYAKYPLESDSIPDNYDDHLTDIPAAQREKVRQLYRFNLQKRLQTYKQYLPDLQENSKERIKNNKNYQEMLKEIKEKDKTEESLEEEEPEPKGHDDLQLQEAYSIMKDLIYLMQIGKPTSVGAPKPLSAGG